MPSCLLIQTTAKNISDSSLNNSISVCLSRQQELGGGTSTSIFMTKEWMLGEQLE